MRNKKERPILFSGSMVRAILKGNKTMTRRIIKPQPSIVHQLYDDASIETNLNFRRGDQRIHCPYGKPGDLLWVRETWGVIGDKHHRFCYRADPQHPQGRSVLQLDGGRWRPSIHMPRWASRILLEITEVRIERLQDISEEDAFAEGIDAGLIPAFGSGGNVFENLWENTYGPDSWTANPWVWVVEFKMTEAQNEQ